MSLCYHDVSFWMLLENYLIFQCTILAFYFLSHKCTVTFQEVDISFDIIRNTERKQILFLSRSMLEDFQTDPICLKSQLMHWYRRRKVFLRTIKQQTKTFPEAQHHVRTLTLVPSKMRENARWEYGVPTQTVPLCYWDCFSYEHSRT